MKGKRKLNNWSISLIINLLMLAFIFAVGKLSYESTDDYYIAIMLKANANCILSINKYVCMIISALQSVFPKLNMFVFLGILASFAAFVVFYKIVLDKEHSTVFKVMAAAVVLVFAWDHYACIQYTKVCSLLAIVSIMVLADSLIYQRTAGYYVLAALGILFCTGVRPEVTLAAIAMAACYAFIMLIDKDSELGEKLKTRTGMLRVIVTVLIILSSFAFNRLSLLDPAISEYREYNDLRSSIIDYPVYENYDELKGELGEIGINKNDVSLIDKWYVDFDGAASKEKMGEILNVYEGKFAKGRAAEAVKQFYKNTKKWVREVDRNGAHIILVVLLALGGFVMLRPRKSIFILVIGALTMLLYIYLHYMGRVIYRGTYILDIGAAFWLLYYYEAGMVRESLAENVARVGKLLCIILTLAALVLQYPYYDYAARRSNYNISRIMESDLSTYIERNSENVYVIATREKGNPVYFRNPLTIPDESYRRNLLDFGGWETTSPYEMDRLKRNNLNNVFGDLIDNDKAFVIDSKNKKALEKYFNKWYGTSDKIIVFEEVDRIVGHNVWRVVTRDKTS